MTEAQVAELAVLADPELQALRAQVDVAQAQMRAAGLPPDPLLMLSSALLLSTGPGLSNPLALSIGEDISRLITRGDARAAAAEHLHGVNFQVLWQEWLVAQRARQLWVGIRSADAETPLFRQQIQLYRQALDAYRSAAAADALTELDLVQWRSGLLHAEVTLAGAQRQRDAAQASLRLLLGLAPQAAVPLSGHMQRLLPSPQRIATALASLPQHRPDLLALAAGYRSADARLREQILAQFPGVSVQVNRSRDNSAVNMAGLAVGLQLPVFNGNRGNIAVARASRHVLLEQYQGRLDSDTSEVPALYRGLSSIASELRIVEKPLLRLRETAAQAQRAFNAGALDWTAYVGAKQTYFERASLALSLQSTLAQGRVALQTLLGVTDPTPERVTAKPNSRQPS
ncbi:MAG: TolC family protein [Casimicrobiaceae bacterium]